MDIPGRPSQSLASTSSQIIIAHRSQSSEMHTYLTPSTVADYPHAIDEDFCGQEIFQDILEPKNPMPSENDIIMALLDKEIDFCNRENAGADHDAQYFDDDDLYYAAQTDDTYDYPRGIDDEDEEDDADSYTRDPDLCAIFAQHDQNKWASFEFNGFEDGISNTQYFDAVELYEHAEFPASAYYEDMDMDSDTSGESDGDQMPHADTRSSQEAWHTSLRHFGGRVLVAGSTPTMALSPERLGTEAETVSRHFSRTNIVF